MCMGHQGRTLNSECSYGIDGRAPAVADGDTIIFDEQGRCQPQVNGKGSTDYHSHHFRVVKERYGGYRLLVRHGGGDEGFDLGGGYTRIPEILALLDSDARYLMLQALYGTRRDALEDGRVKELVRWNTAAIEKRIKTRKMPKRGFVKVWIEEAR